MDLFSEAESFPKQLVERVDCNIQDVLQQAPEQLSDV